MPLLFSYGTLQLPEVQMQLFGRLLEGSADELVGFRHVPIDLDGEGQYSIVRFDGRPGSRVAGTALELSEGELAAADAYEPPPYKRISTVLVSGKQAWVYADEVSRSS